LRVHIHVPRGLHVSCGGANVKGAPARAVSKGAPAVVNDN
jgi:hypothetical protein